MSLYLIDYENVREKGFEGVEKLKKTPREVPGWTFFGVLFFAMNAGMYPTGQ